MSPVCRLWLKASYLSRASDVTQNLLFSLEYPHTTIERGSWLLTRTQVSKYKLLDTWTNIHRTRDTSLSPFSISCMIVRSLNPLSIHIQKESGLVSVIRWVSVPDLNSKNLSFKNINKSQNFGKVASKFKILKNQSNSSSPCMHKIADLFNRPFKSANKRK